MLKKCVCFLLITLLLMFSACHTKAPTESTEQPTANASTETIISCPSSPSPTFSFHCFTKGDYENFLKNEDLSLPLFSTDSLATFGDFYSFEVTVYDNGFDIRYEYVFEGVNTTLNVSPLTVDENASYEVIWIEDGDVSENLYMYPLEYWIRLPDETIYDQLYEKYFSDTNGHRSLRYQVSENIYMQYVSQSHTDMIFSFDGYEIVLTFGGNREDLKYGNNIVCPMTKALLTKSTAPQTAEELYNLWKDALK